MLEKAEQEVLEAAVAFRKAYRAPRAFVKGTEENAKLQEANTTLVTAVDVYLGVKRFTENERAKKVSEIQR